jgi:hypothetical protein
MATTKDPWNVNVVTAEEIPPTTPRWWRTAGDLGTPRPWWEEAAGPAFGGHASLDPGSWIGLAMTKKAIAGGPPVHVGNFEGNTSVPPQRLIETLVELVKVRPIRLAYGRQGSVRGMLFSNDESMMSLAFSDGGHYVDVDIATSRPEVFAKVAKLCAGILSQEPVNSKKGYVYALAKGQFGYHLTRVGAAGTPLERDNYNPEVLASYDHIVTDLQAEAPCGRLIIMAGLPGGGKTFMVRSLLADIPKAAFIIVPPHLVAELGSPDLLPALVSAKQDGLTGPMALVIEDADKVLVERTAGDMAAISSLLNLGDGILGSVLDVRIIATTNARKIEMDEATRRKGRLCRYLDIGPLQPDQAETVLHRLTGASKRPATAVALAEVYGQARALGWTPPPKVKPPSPWDKQYVL